MTSVGIYLDNAATSWPKPAEVVDETARALAGWVASAGRSGHRPSLETARVVFETLPGRGWCLHCADSVDIAALYDACPRCGSYQVQPTGGTEMRVKDLLVE